MGESEPLNVTEAEHLTNELKTAFEGVKTAVSVYGEVQGRVNRFLEETNAIPPPPEGLETDVNDLLLFWRTTPDCPELESLLRTRLY